MQPSVEIETLDSRARDNRCDAPRNHPGGPHNWRTRRWLIQIILLICIPLAMFEAWWLTPDRDYYKEMDFAVFYSAGKMFAHGQNPYDRAKAEDVWLNAEGDWDVMKRHLRPARRRAS